MENKFESLRIGSYPGLYCWFDFVLKMLNEFGFDAPELKTDLFLDENKIIQIGVLPVELEIITSISEVEIGTQHE